MSEAFIKAVDELAVVANRLAETCRQRDELLCELFKSTLVQGLVPDAFRAGPIRVSAFSGTHTRRLRIERGDGSIEEVDVNELDDATRQRCIEILFNEDTNKKGRT